MARPLRLEFPGALYHVTARGNARAAIFEDDAACQCFLEGDLVITADIPLASDIVAGQRGFDSLIAASKNSAVGSRPLLLPRHTRPVPKPMGITSCVIPVPALYGASAVVKRS
jgi:hypothetical protein